MLPVGSGAIEEQCRTVAFQVADSNVQLVAATLRFEHGDAGLCDRARTPRCSPRATAREVVSKILYLRQHYHFGAGRIAAYLSRFHQIAIAVSSVHRILTRHGMPRLPANQKHRPHGKRWQRYEKPRPGHRLQLDVKFLERIPGTRRRLYQFTAIDDCTRIRVLTIYEACNQRTATQFIDEVVRRLPFRVHVVQTDNGAEFQSAFHWHLEHHDQPKSLPRRAGNGGVIIDERHWRRGATAIAAQLLEGRNG
jgi:hypothetical protein